MRLVTLGGFFALSFAAGCKKDDDVDVVQFNNVNDTFEVSISPDAPADAPNVVAELRSNSGAVVVGEVTISPGSGPVGTEHHVVAIIDDDYEDRLVRGDLEVSGERGTQTFPMRQDSADPGAWDAVVISLGDDGESRTDTFRILLWEPTEAPAIEEKGK